MNIQKKSLLIITITLITLVTVLYFTVSKILINSFETLEDETSIQNSERVYKAIYNKISNMNALVVDWSEWDDTYKFMADKNVQYIDSNIVDGSFTDSDLNFILYYNTKNELFYGKGFDLENEEEIAVPTDIKNYINKHKEIILEYPEIGSNILGIIEISEKPLMIVSHQILTSEAEGPSRGSLIFARYFDQSIIEEISELTDFKISTININDIENYPELENIIDSFSDSETTVLVPVGTNKISAFKQIKDLANKPILLLEVDMMRSIYLEGLKTINYFLFALLVIGLVFTILVILLLQRVILSRVQKLSKDVKNIGFDESVYDRLHVNSNDEISELGNQINIMLDRLEDTKNKLKSSRNELEIKVEQRTSELKKSENKLKGSLEEKEILLKEIHHRVKNNLQIISSLLSFQIESPIGDKSVLTESQNRISSMALIHEYLYKSDDLASINFNDYTQNLISNLIRIYKIDSGSININTDIEDINLKIESAVPCGLILNELISNSLKYAFPNGSCGEISIEFKKDENGKVNIICSDNGIGIPNEIDIKNTKTLGLKLVHMLTEQLEGTIELDRTNGTKFIMEFVKL